MKTATKTITRGIYNRVSTGQYVGGVEQFRHEKVGEKITVYNFTAEGDKLTINGKSYKVEEDREFVIKILKTKIKARGGAEGLMNFFASNNDSWDDQWERLLIEKCRPIA